MRDRGSEPPICRSLGPDHHEGNHATRNLTRGKCVRKEREGADAREGGRTLEICRVSDSREGGE
jgi:hypothetical protein